MSKNINGELLTIPLYLNTKIVFDMLATIEDGFSTVRNIQTSQNNSKEEIADANFGTNNIFSLLSVGVRGNQKIDKENGEMVYEEKTHTTVSLFQKLRVQLEESKLIVHDIDKAKIGSFIEIQGELKKNPVIEMLTAIEELMKLLDLFSEQGSQKKNQKEKIVSNRIFYAQIEGLINSLQVAGKTDIICKTETYNIVLPTEESYFLNNNMSEIIDGQYRVLGKIVQIHSDEGEISLLRNTAFSKLQIDKLEEFKKAFQEPSLAQFFSNNEFITSVNAPVIMVIPIAIFI